jgi:hypothetical protein
LRSVVPNVAGGDVIGQRRQLHEEKTPKIGQESIQIRILERWLGGVQAMSNDLTDSVKSLRIEITALQETLEELRSVMKADMLGRLLRFLERLKPT